MVNTEKPAKIRMRTLCATIELPEAHSITPKTGTSGSIVSEFLIASPYGWKMFPWKSSKGRLVKACHSQERIQVLSAGSPRFHGSVVVTDSLVGWYINDTRANKTTANTATRRNRPSQLIRRRPLRTDPETKSSQSHPGPVPVSSPPLPYSLPTEMLEPLSAIEVPGASIADDIPGCPQAT